ncbi:MAG: hydantoinase/oxoprolinase family protein [Candidatus Methanoplasma sp.]|jgi:N-methylhydantoinase A/oxoprolinase/acetone carboxylase beta subunit|nr:hydantoinase/oxoprolinase family protein [Candidatus Methanoplasma sp.]
MHVCLGFDTGGTYTDAVLMDMSENKVLQKSKALTTRDDLSVGVRNTMVNFDKELLKNVAMVSLSSTLATNSIVEGKGCRVGLICVGEEFDMSIPVDVHTTISGGHDLIGNEVAELDEASAKKFMASIKGRVDGLAINSYLSIRNPEHELRLKKIAKEVLDVPVVCGHELSSSLGYHERTTTSVMNSRLIPIIKDLMDSVKKVMGEHKIEAPLMIVKGDGSIMNESVALERPIETILSGPAASLIGAKMLTGRNDAIVMDMGGTTTDIGILRNGQPRLEKEGAMIGNRRTRVMAAEISTSGIGGDSRIIVNGSKFMLEPVRVIPLCIAATMWPQLLPRLKVIGETKSGFSPESMDVRNIVQDTEFFIKIKDLDNVHLSKEDKALLDLISDEPFSLKEAGSKLNVHPFSFDVSKMEELGIVYRIGLTPTDLLHAEGKYEEYSKAASNYAVAHQSQKMNMTDKEFVQFAKGKVVDKLAEVLLKKLFFEETNTFDIDTIGLDLMWKAISGLEGLDFGCSIRLNKPLIGIGAPVAAWFPQVAEKFGTELLLPEHSEVGNAVGAVTGSVIESMDILLKPSPGENSLDDPSCILFAPFGRFEFEKLSEAEAFAVKEGSKHVKERAEKAGADLIEVRSEKIEKKIGFGRGYDGHMLIEAIITIMAVGKPRQFTIGK